MDILENQTNVVLSRKVSKFLEINSSLKTISLETNSQPGAGSVTCQSSKHFAVLLAQSFHLLFCSLLTQTILKLDKEKSSDHELSMFMHALGTVEEKKQVKNK